jgi:Domain of unknown function (DUF1995)
MPELPQTLEQAVDQAQTATQMAIADGLIRLQVELLFPELKVMPIAQRFITAFEGLGEELRVFFPDPGAAALARRDWGEKPYAIRGIGELKATIQPHERIFLFIEPSSVEVPQVEELCQEAEERPVVLFLPHLEDVATIGIGYAGRQLRGRFLNQFESCYYLRPLEGAVLLRCYPSAWQVWLEKDGTYELLTEEPQKPSGEALVQILMKATGGAVEKPQHPPKRGLMGGLKQFLRALSQ